MAAYHNTNRKKSKQQINRAIGISLICISVLMILFTTTNWLYFIKSFFLGTFGVMCYPIFAINIFIGLGYITNRKFLYSFKYIAYVFCAFLCVIAILHIAVTTKLNDANYLAYLGACYKAKFTAGGLIIGIITYPITGLLNDAAGYVLFSIILVILIALIIDYLYAYKQFARLHKTTSRETDEEEAEEIELPTSTIPISQENIYFTQETEPQSYDYVEEEQQPQLKEPEPTITASDIARKRLGLDKAKEPENKSEMTSEQKRAYILREDDDYKNERTYQEDKSITNWLTRDYDKKEPEQSRPPKYVNSEDQTQRQTQSQKRQDSHNRSREYINSLYGAHSNQNPIINADSYKSGQALKIQPEPTTNFNNNNRIISSVEDFTKPGVVTETKLEPKQTPIINPQPIEPIRTQNFEFKTKENLQNIQDEDERAFRKAAIEAITVEPEIKPTPIIKSVEEEPETKKVSPLNPINLKTEPEIVELNLNQPEPIITSIDETENIETKTNITNSLNTTFNLPSSFKKPQDIQKEKYEQTMMMEAEKPKKPAAPKYRKPSNYVRPPYDLLTTVSTNPDNFAEEQQQRIAILESKLEEFNIPAKVIAVRRGSAVTRYELQMPVGIAVKKIFAHSDDIAMALAANGDIRIEAPIRGKSAVGIEVPNASIDTVGLRDVVESSNFVNNTSPLAFALGKDVDGNLATCNLAKAPHLLVAGSTGSGKSVCLNALIISLLYKTSPEDLKFILVDPKRVEFGVFNHLPHMLIPKAITEPKKALNAFDWLIMEMERRYMLFEESYVKNVEEYNAQSDVVRGTVDKLPYIVLIVDEFADLLLAGNKKELEERVRRLTAKARAAGIHLILATQRPSVDVITGVIKLNLPTRIAFAVTDFQSSKTILDQSGAEKLLGKGDMLFSMQNSEPCRIQGAFVTTKEVVDIVTFIKENNETFFDDNIQESIEHLDEETPQNVIQAPSEQTEKGWDVLLPKALKYCIETNQATISMLQRRFSIGFTRSGRIVDQMEKAKFIGPSDGNKNRSVYITMEQFNELFGDVDIDD